MAVARLLVVAGEASGDQLAARVVTELGRLAGPVEVRGMGGSALARAGMELEVDLRHTTALGTVEVLARLPRIAAAFARLERLARRWAPQAALLVDLPDFNLPLAARLRRQGVAVQGLVAPQFWAWRWNRVVQIARLYDGMACLFPFEPGPLRRAGARAAFVGHPLAEAGRWDRQEARRRLDLRPRAPCLALLPGSRPGEVRRLLPPLLAAAERLRRDQGELQVLLPVAPSLDSLPPARLPWWLRAVTEEVEPAPGRLVLAAADAAVVASGTATLEAALLAVPQVVVYRLSPVSHGAARLLVRTRFFSLPNIVLRRREVPECLQGEVNPDVIHGYVSQLLRQPSPAARPCAAAQELRQALSGPGAKATARFVARLLER